MRDIYCPKCGDFERDTDADLFCNRCEIPKEIYTHVEHAPHVFEKVSPHMIMGDIGAYQSMVDGTMIEGRKQHRDHLKRHSLIEVGNETKHLKPYGDYTPKGVKQDLIENLQRYRAQNRK